MVIKITGRHVELPARLKSHIESRVQKIGRYIDGITDVHVTLSTEKYRQIAEVNVHCRGNVHLSAKEASEDIKASVTQAIEKLEAQAKRQTEKRIHKKRRRAARFQGVGTFNVISSDRNIPPADRRVVESRRFVIKPLTVEEAVIAIDEEQAEFLVFRNAMTDSTNVLYRRPDGNFGLIAPEL